VRHCVLSLVRSCNLNILPASHPQMSLSLSLYRVDLNLSTIRSATRHRRSSPRSQRLLD